MTLHSVKFYLLQLAMLLILSACSAGVDEESGNNDSVSGTNAQLSVSISNSLGEETNSITEGNSAVITVTLTDSTNLAITNHKIEFSSLVGNLSATSRLTDDNGQAQVTFSSIGITPSVVSVSVSTEYNEESLSLAAEFEILETVTEDFGESTLALSLKKDGEITNGISIDESAQLSVSLLSGNGDPISGTVVTFTAELGTLNASSALTNANGIAEVSLTGVEGQLGAALATATVNLGDVTLAKSLAYEVVEKGPINENILLGRLTDEQFFSGEIHTDIIALDGSSTINAGASLGLTVTLVDEEGARYTTPTTVTFTSSCVDNNDATLDLEVTTINGEATSTYQDIRCASALGNEDIVIATVKVNSADITASHIINIEPEVIGSIEFVSSSPESIVLKGTGGQGKQETATLTFLVKGELGNPIAQQEVTFALNTDAGGLKLASESGVTNSDGLVSAKVISGTVPTTVRVTAKVAAENNTIISTQSDLLSVNTGLPDQNSITISAEVLNPEAFDYIGEQVKISAYLADSFNNPVPDGTTVNFTTEGGAIEPSCNTTSGTCNVLWTSQEPFTEDHRVTILATAIGHETFIDANGNNFFDEPDIFNLDTDADGKFDAISDGHTGVINSSITNIEQVQNGFSRAGTFSTGFLDMKEAWRDDNENGLHDNNELFIDADGNGEFNDEDALFNGPQCEGSLCSNDSEFITVRKALVLITSSSFAHIRITENGYGDGDNSDGDEGDGTLLSSNYSTETESSLSIAAGTNADVFFAISDTKLQSLPKDTRISISWTLGDNTASYEYIVNNSNCSAGIKIKAVRSDYCGSNMNITISNPAVNTEPGTLTVSVVTPNSNNTSSSVTILVP